MFPWLQASEARLGTVALRCPSGAAGLGALLLAPGSVYPEVCQPSAQGRQGAGCCCPHASKPSRKGRSVRSLSLP